MEEKMNNSITVSDFINTRYRQYWEYSNKNGKNSISPREQLPEVVRKIIYAAYMINVKEHAERKTVELKGEVAKYHAHGDSSIEDSIKGVATAYKSQPATRLLEGIGNFGSAPGDEGAAGRYTSISGTPLLTAIYRDIPFVPKNTDDTGLEQPEYISCPLPMALINGMSSIGIGKSCYLAERNASEIIDWIDKIRKLNFDREKIDGKNILPPDAMSVTDCNTYYNNANGYIYYDAVVHWGVDINDLNKRGKFDIITNLPPKSTPQNVIYKLQNKLSSRITNKIIDGSGKGRPTYIIVPKGYLKEEDFSKYGLRLARKESIYVWHDKKNTMALSDILNIAKEWFEDRCSIVSKRLNEQKINYKANNHKIDLIKIFAENKMIDWTVDEVNKYFINLAKENDFHGFDIDENHEVINYSYEEAGIRDANLVLSQSARTFLPENLKNNEITRTKNNKNIDIINKEIENIGDFVIKEARDIINAQNKFFEN